MKDLTNLRKIAEQATPGPWVLDGFGEGGCSEGCCKEYTRLSVYSGTNQGEVVASEVTAQRNADYLDTFDPPTVLALLARLEQAEQEAKASKGVITQHIAERSLETHRNVGIAVDEAVKAVVQLLIEDPSRRAREAEAAVARVRDVATGEPTEYGWSEAMLAVLRALDGDGRG